jgi:hypothetical protein
MVRQESCSTIPGYSDALVSQPFHIPLLHAFWHQTALLGSLSAQCPQPQATDCVRHGKELALSATVSRLMFQQQHWIFCDDGEPSILSSPHPLCKRTISDLSSNSYMGSSRQASDSITLSFVTLMIVKHMFCLSSRLVWSVCRFILIHLMTIEMYRLSCGLVPRWFFSR